MMKEIETPLKKECEFCGVKENCNNYWLGKEDALKEILEFILSLKKDTSPDTNQWVKGYNTALNDIASGLEELKQSLEAKK